MRDVQDGNYVWAADLKNIFDSNENEMWVLNGCLPTWSVGMSVTVSAGNIYFQGAAVAVGGGLHSHDVEAILNVRYDLITVNSVGTIVVTKGTIEGIAPSIPANETLLAVVRILNGVAALTAPDVAESRYIRPDNILEVGSGVVSGGIPLLSGTVSNARPILVSFAATSSLTTEVNYTILYAGVGFNRVKFYLAAGANGNIDYKIMSA